MKVIVSETTLHVDGVRTEWERKTKFLSTDEDPRIIIEDPTFGWKRPHELLALVMREYDWQGETGVDFEARGVPCLDRNGYPRDKRTKHESYVSAYRMSTMAFLPKETTA